MVRKKKILFFIEAFGGGGAERSLIGLLNNFDHGRFDVEVMRIKKNGVLEQLLHADIPLSYIDIQYSLWSRMKFKISRLLNFQRKYHNAQLFWRCVKNDVPEVNTYYDVAIAWGQGFATYFVAERVKNAAKKLAWVNNDLNKAGYCMEADKYIYENFDNVVGVSGFVKEEMQKILGESKVVAIQNIVDLGEVRRQAQQVSETKFPEDKINIVSVGRLVKQKGFDLGIRAIGALIEKGYPVHFYIVGEGAARTYLEKLIAACGMKGHITLLGFYDNPYPFMKAADVYLQTSRFEGLGRTLMEAKILQKPIVSTNFSTAFEILEHGKTGMITEMDPTAIAAGIEKLITDGALRESLINNLKMIEEKGKEQSLEAVYRLIET